MEGRRTGDPKKMMFGVRFESDARKILSVAKKVKKMREIQLDGIKRSGGADLLGPKRSRELKALEEELELRVEALHEEVPYRVFKDATVPYTDAEMTSEKDRQRREFASPFSGPAGPFGSASRAFSDYYKP